MMRARMRGDGTWAMSLEVSNTPRKPATRSLRSCSRFTRNMPHHTFQRHSCVHHHNHDQVLLLAWLRSSRARLSLPSSVLAIPRSMSLAGGETNTPL
jgi:hypothetical protein